MVARGNVFRPAGPTPVRDHPVPNRVPDHPEEFSHVSLWSLTERRAIDLHRVASALCRR